MITYVDFSLFESPAKVLVNTVNTVGVMGKGIAKEFKRIYPEMFTEYQQLCEQRQFNVGDLWLYKTPHKWILNFPTKKHWRSPSKPEYIKAGLQRLFQIHQEVKITSISFPLLGCGNGELNWNTEVKPLMEHYLKDLPIESFIHLDSARSRVLSEHKNPTETKRWLRGEPQSLPFSEVWDDLIGVVENNRQFVTLDGKERFTAEIFHEDEGGIFVEAKGAMNRLHRAQLSDLWRQIRGVGLCIPSIMPSGLDNYSKYILPMMAELDYLNPIQQARRDTDLNENANGLLLKSKLQKHPKTKSSPKQIRLV